MQFIFIDGKNMSALSNVVGLHAVESLLKHQPERIVRLCVLSDRRDKKINAIIELAKEQQIHLETISRQEFERLSEGLLHHQGVLALCTSMRVYTENDLPQLISTKSSSLILVLDGVQDPHNLGACFRSADAAGVTAIIAPKDKSVGITPIVSKVASGAAETVPFVQVTNLVRALSLLKDNSFWIYGATHDATETIYQTDLRGNVALVLGGEGAGLRRLTRENCDVLIKIPMHGSVSSLNVSVAAAVCLFEAVRQRLI